MLVSNVKTKRSHSSSTLWSNEGKKHPRAHRASSSSQGSQISQMEIVQHSEIDDYSDQDIINEDTADNPPPHYWCR